MILVTGATGYIGRRLAGLLLERYSRKEIICLVRPTDGSRKEQTGRDNLRSLGLQICEADILSGKGLSYLPKSPQIIFHLASCTDTSAEDHSINDVGTKNLLEAVGPLGPGTQIVFTSSIAVNDGRKDYSKPMTENEPMPVRPYHIYGRKKLLAEEYLMQRAKADGFALSVIRVCGVFGPDSIEKGLYFSLRRLVLERSWLARLDWPGRISSMYVEDMAWFIREVAQYKPADGTSELYIPSVQSPTVAQMCEAYAKAYGIDYRSIRLPVFIWCCLEWLTGRKRLWEKILPHKIYNAVWQSNILVGQGYWNESVKMAKVVGSRHLTSFEEFSRLVAAQEGKGGS